MVKAFNPWKGRELESSYLQGQQMMPQILNQDFQSPFQVLISSNLLETILSTAFKY